MGGMRDMGATSCQLITDEAGPLGGSDDTVYERGHYIFGKADGSELAVGKYVIMSLFILEIPPNFRVYPICISCTASNKIKIINNNKNNTCVVL